MPMAHEAVPVLRGSVCRGIQEKSQDNRQQQRRERVLPTPEQVFISNDPDAFLRKQFFVVEV